ncbi:unnamed protein product [Cutaneotrichosporon oleaginosum]
MNCSDGDVKQVDDGSRNARSGDWRGTERRGRGEECVESLSTDAFSVHSQGVCGGDSARSERLDSENDVAYVGEGETAAR